MKLMDHMINRKSHAFSWNSENNCTQKHVITYTNNNITKYWRYQLLFLLSCMHSNVGFLHRLYSCMIPTAQNKELEIESKNNDNAHVSNVQFISFLGYACLKTDFSQNIHSVPNNHVHTIWEFIYVLQCKATCSAVAISKQKENLSTVPLIPPNKHTGYAAIQLRQSSYLFLQFLTTMVFQLSCSTFLLQWRPK